MKSDHDLDKLTSNWGALNRNLRLLNEDEIKRSLARRVELGTGRDIAIRLHQRLCSLRAERERAELIAVFEDVPAFLGGSK